MNEKLLVIYDNTGKIWGLYSGEESAPIFMGAILTEAPENFTEVYMDMSTNPPTVKFVVEEPEQI